MDSHDQEGAPVKCRGENHLNLGEKGKDEGNADEGQAKLAAAIVAPAVGEGLVVVRLHRTFEDSEQARTSNSRCDAVGMVICFVQNLMVSSFVRISLNGPKSRTVKSKGSASFHSVDGLYMLQGLNKLILGLSRHKIGLQMAKRLHLNSILYHLILSQMGNILMITTA